MKIVAIFTVFNEERQIARAIRHLVEQGVESYVIDNGSTDRTLEVVQGRVGNGVIGVERLARRGQFELRAQLRRKEELHRTLGADWYLHHDADEIREAPSPFANLRQGIVAADKAGYSAIDFDEFVFLPTSRDEVFTPENCVEQMQYYCFLLPNDPSRDRINAWKNTGQTIDLQSSGGHQVRFEGRRVFPDNFILRHYIVLSFDQAVRKYCSRRYDAREFDELTWHGARALVRPEDFRFPRAEAMCRVRSDRTWERSSPVSVLPLFGAAERRVEQLRRRGPINDCDPRTADKLAEGNVFGEEAPRADD